MEESLTMFERALKKGLGRAMILLCETPENTDFGNALLHACLVNQVYDRQCEEDRVKYLYDLILKTGKLESYRAELFRNLWTPASDSPEIDKAQIFGILCCMAAEGHNIDRGELREFLIAADYHSVGSICIYRYVWLERLDGLLFCIKQFFESLTNNFNEDGWVFRSLVETLKERDGAEVAASALQNARSNSPELNELMRLSDTDDCSAAPAPTVALDYVTAKDGLDPKRGFPRSLIKTANIEELKLAASDLLIERDEKKVWRYLQIFGGRDFPLPPAELFRFIQSENKRVSRAAVRALQRLNHPDIRELALRTIADVTNPELAIRLLASNFQPGDLRAVEVLIDGLSLDEETWHRIGLATLELLGWATVPSEESRSLFLQLYEETPCSLCRSGFAKKLLAAGDAPDWMANEARFDADPQMVGLFKVSPDATEAGQVASN